MYPYVGIGRCSSHLSIRYVLLDGLDLGPGGEGPALHGLGFGVGAMKAGVAVLLDIL